MFRVPGVEAALADQTRLKKIELRRPRARHPHPRPILRPSREHFARAAELAISFSGCPALILINSTGPCRRRIISRAYQTKTAATVCRRTRDRPQGIAFVVAQRAKTPQATHSVRAHVRETGVPRSPGRPIRPCSSSEVSFCKNVRFCLLTRAIFAPARAQRV